MSQDYNSISSRKQRRAARANRNRPTLVTSAEQAEEQGQEATTSVAVSEPVVEAEAPVVPTPAPTPRSRRLPNFFSTVGKNEQKEEQENDAAQARIARATRKATPTAKTSVVKPERVEKLEKAKPIEEKPRPASRPTTSGRPGTFKTRYIFGMVIYLLVAQVAGVLITGLFQSNKIDSVLTTFNLFGGQVVIRTSTLVYLALLVIILVLLARFDLLPRSLASATNPPASKPRQSSETLVSNKLPQERSGVQGADDALYREYRANRRKK